MPAQIIHYDRNEGDTHMNDCPCGSGNTYAQCCEPIIGGARTAETAQELMRARYTAYTKAETEFLFDTTHPDHRKGYDRAGTQEWAEKSEWLGLEIVEISRGGAEDTVGGVEFIARFREKDLLQAHHELGHFKREEGAWYFTHGEMVKPKPAVSAKVGRNEPCPCGSGLKFKKCCGK
jgi:SEC-C motif-containing protein